MDWTDFFGGLALLAPVGTSIAQAVNGPQYPVPVGNAGAVYIPQTGQLVNTGGVLGGTGSSSILIILLIVIGLIFALRR